MPKQKPNKGLTKRVKITKGGKLRRMKAGRRHLMGSKSGKRVRHLGKPGLVSAVETRKLKRMLGLA